jgi:hypothetical protein
MNPPRSIDRSGSRLLWGTERPIGEVKHSGVGVRAARRRGARVPTVGGPAPSTVHGYVATPARPVRWLVGKVRIRQCATAAGIQAPQEKLDRRVHCEMCRRFRHSPKSSGRPTRLRSGRT